MTLTANDSLTETATVTQAVARALKRAAIIESNASPAAADLSDGIEALNDMLDGLAADGLATADQTLEATVTSGDPAIKDLESTSNLAVGMHVTGSGIPASTKVQSIDSGTQVTLDKDATATGSEVSLSFTAIPFDAKHTGGLIAMLAVRLCEDYGKTPGPVLARDAERGESQLRAAFLHVPKATFDMGLTRTPSQIIRGSE